MNRPRNRQSRPPRQHNERGGRGGRSGRGNPAFSGHSPRPTNSHVPTVQEVVPGASVSIVLKQDQPTGREVQGTVQDLLTRGNHPRGIKVRLTDGRVGRVQRMVVDGSAPVMMTRQRGDAHGTVNVNVQTLRDRGFASRDDVEVEGPPPRTLADYLPDTESEDEVPQVQQPNQGMFVTATAKCPVCGLFEGDEVAVSHHVESHFT